MLAKAILAALFALPQPHYASGLNPETPAETRARYERIAAAVATASTVATCSDQPEGCRRVWPGTRRELAAALVTLGWWESKYVWRVHAGKCRPLECDAGRARTPWQMQRATATIRRHWSHMVGTGYVPTLHAAWAAAVTFSTAARGCSRSPLGPVAGAFSGYARGSRIGRCTWRQGLNRARTYRVVLRRLSNG